MTESLREEVRAFYETRHDARASAGLTERYLETCLLRVLRAQVPPGLRVLQIGCGSGNLLAGLQPSYGVGIDLASRAVAAARQRHPGAHLRFVEGDGSSPAILAEASGPFDVILLANVVTELVDVQSMFAALHAVSHARTRIMVFSSSRLWQPLLRVAEALGLRHASPVESWLPPEEVENMLDLADLEVVRRDRRVFCPFWIPILSDLLNRWAAPLPGLQHLDFLYGLVARPAPHRASPLATRPSVSVVIPCRNESGHIRPLVARLPDLPEGSEFLFVEGHSKDDTEQVIRDVVAENPGRPFRFLKQPGKGKGDAVRHAFAEARGDIVLILDSDMGVAPEDVPRFVDALVRGKGELINGSRLVYPMEGRAMRFLNLLANKAFAILFGWLLGQQVRDTLCGTKALWRSDYELIARHRSYFGDFDPFGDFDLLFGATRLNLRIRDMAVRYHERTYGETNISRFRHGLLLLRMSAFAARKLKFP